jgi:glycosyltransferase involved in cell wall biosynthesis
VPQPRRFGLWRNLFLPRSETFVHDELRAHERWRGTVLCLGREAGAAFPWPDVVRVAAPRALCGRAAAIDGALAGCELVHAHFAHNAAWALPFARRHRLPLVVSLHGRDVAAPGGLAEPAWWPWWWRRRAVWREAALFLAASDDLAREAVRRGFPRDRVVVHRLGVDLERFRPPPAPALGLPQVLMVGRLVPKKGHEDGLRAFARARAAGLDARLALVGAGPLLPALRRLVAELGLADRVELAGPLAHDAVAARLQRTAVLLAPSVVARDGDRDSGLMVAKEAAACGVPVLATCHGGLPEIVDDGATGALVAEGDWRALGDRLAALLRDPPLRAAWGAAGRLKMEREYDLHARVRALEAIYDDVAARRANRASTS